MSEAQPLPPENEIDDELKQALAAAFGDDAMSLLDDDEDDEIPAEMLASAGDELGSTSSSEVPAGESDGQSGNDVSPLLRLMNQLSSAVHSSSPLPLPTGTNLAIDQKQSASRAQRFVLFAIGEQRFGVPLEDVREIASYPKVTELPRTPTWLRGVANLRGQIISITDLRNLLQITGERPAVGEKIVVIHGQQNAASTAVVVDRVLGIRSLGQQQGGISDLSHRVATIASGTATLDQETTVLIDPDKLFGCDALHAFAS